MYIYYIQVVELSVMLIFSGISLFLFYFLYCALWFKLQFVTQFIIYDFFYFIWSYNGFFDEIKNIFIEMYMKVKRDGLSSPRGTQSIE